MPRCWKSQHRSSAASQWRTRRCSITCRRLSVRAALASRRRRRPLLRLRLPRRNKTFSRVCGDFLLCPDNHSPFPPFVRVEDQARPMTFEILDAEADAAIVPTLRVRAQPDRPRLHPQHPERQRKRRQLLFVIVPRHHIHRLERCCGRWFRLAIGHVLRPPVDHLNERLLAGEFGPDRLEFLVGVACAHVGDRHVLPHERDGKDDAANSDDDKKQENANDDPEPGPFLLRCAVIHNVSSVPAPVSEARRKTRSAATTSSTAIPSDLKMVTSDSAPRPEARPSTSSPTSPRT